MRRRLSALRVLLLAAIMGGISMNVFGFLGFGEDSWKEEVLLHDGRTMIVTRSQIYGGRHEIGQPSPIKEHRISFTLPGSTKTVAWTSEYGEDIGRANFNLLAVHVLNGTAYLVTEPNLCLSYNKWGRPNPPYVFFKYDGKTWQRIPLEELPQEFKTINVVLYLGSHNIEMMVGLPFVPREKVKELNREMRQSTYQTILREPVKPGTEGSNVNCIELVLYKGSWIMPNDPAMHKILDQRGN